MSLRFRFNHAEWERMKSPSGEVGRSVQNAAEVVQRRAKEIIVAENRINTGEMLKNVVVTRQPDQGGVISVSVEARANHSIYQHEGVSPQVAAPGKVFRFRSGGQVIFTKKHSGFSGIKFLTRALATIGVRDYRP